VPCRGGGGVPGLAALNTGGDAEINSVSCPSAGNCSAGGIYNYFTTAAQGWVVSQVRGRWGKVKQVPRLERLNYGNAQVSSVSCGANGNCSAGGYYTNPASLSRAFVVSQIRGTWRKAKKIPGLAALDTGDNSQLNSVSCAAANHCSAGGYYSDSAGNFQAFVVSNT
jgi:hypothetical protein